MSDLIAAHSDLSDVEGEWLHLLVGDWQIVSDLAVADLVLWLPTRDGGFVAVAHCRPSTGTTVHYDDIVGLFASEGQQARFAAALADGRVQNTTEPQWFGEYAVTEQVVPVKMRGGRTIAVIARQTNLGPSRSHSRQELNYAEAADDLLAMASRGEYPSPDSASGPRRGAPRVGDGLIRLNAEGQVLYASPNALSCFHRLGVVGPLVGQSLVELTAGLIEYAGTVDEALPLVVMGRASWRTDIETRGVAVSLRSLPLTVHGQRIGAVLICRDVSELRRRERELMTKDATIREIHHRVKNNLATVAALLRLQSRRCELPEAKFALDEATRRVATISLVHEFLSQTLDEQVELDGMLQRALRMTAELAATNTSVQTVQRGSFGLVPAQDATPLALVLTELVTNAVEHGFNGTRETGTVTVDVERSGSRLRVRVTDDGVGLGTDDMARLSRDSASGLGNQIVRTLVTNELGGTIDWRTGDEGGTEVVIEARLRDGRRG
ncbi:MAG: PAS domain-containing sensor histidine kinase [Promicromonosporaceae bacterium]|nr:PAS domain-containing sensor histidine kinase [Promicromonosporaceae bacterium]